MTRYRLFHTSSVIAILIITVCIALFFEIGFAESVQKNASMKHLSDPDISEFQNQSPYPTQPIKIEEKHLVELSLDTGNTNPSPMEPLFEPFFPDDIISLNLDDSQAETAIGVDDGSNHAVQFVWLNRFTPAPATFPFTLKEIRILFSGSGISNGLPIDLVVYEDLDSSPPIDADWLTTYPVTIQAVDGFTWSVYTLDPPVRLDGPGDVLIGAINRYVNSGIDPMSWPASIDETTSQGRSWSGWWTSDPPHPPILPPNNTFDIIDNLGFPGNWMIRGYGETLLSAPNLITPANGATINDNTPHFDWSSVAGATLYSLQVDTQMNFSNPEVNITTSNSAYTPTSALKDEKYYWRVRARDGSGTWGIWSSPTWSFTIKTGGTGGTVFLPISIKEYKFFFEGPWEVEPNNDWQHANGPIRSGRDYYGYPDEKDFFSFYTNKSGSISIDLADHTGQDVQLQLFYQDINNLVDFDSVPPFHIDRPNQPPGRYYIYIFTKSGHNQQNKYTLKASYP
jgi:hypothetical protein